MHVTQVSYTARTWRERHNSGRWVTLTDAQWERFRAVLRAPQSEEG